MFIPCLMDSFMLFFLSVFPRCFCFLRFFSFLWRTSFWIRRKECCQITRMDVACEMAGDGTTWGCRRPFRQREPLAWESEFRWGKQRRHSCLACYPALRPRPSSNEPAAPSNRHPTHTHTHTKKRPKKEYGDIIIVSTRIELSIETWALIDTGADDAGTSAAGKLLRTLR